MRYELNIEYSEYEMKKSKQRMNSYENFLRSDRVPVNFCLVPRYFTNQFGINYSELFISPEKQYELLLQFAKYQHENIHSDSLTEPVIHIHPYFDNVTCASHFGGNIIWPENETPQAVPVIKSIDEMDRFEVPDLTAGLFGTIIQWWFRMKELAEVTKVTFNGKPGRIAISNLNIMPLGPHMIAIDLIGSDFYWWCIEYPELCKKFLKKITKGLIDAEEYVRKIDPRIGAYDSYSIAEDTSTVMSIDMFREFAVPFDLDLYRIFGKKNRGMHMCGPSSHLHKSITDDLHITSFLLFGYQVKPTMIKDTMGGRVRLWGNINPMLMHTGSRDEVFQEVMKTLEVLGPLNGYMLGDGANICPGTPIANINTLVEASKRYSEEHPEYFQN